MLDLRAEARPQVFEGVDDLEGAWVRRERVVVTGGAGFLGSHLCERLLNDGYEVVALDSFVTGSLVNVEHLMADPAFRLVRTDVCDPVDLPGQVDAVLHFASPASPTDYLRLPIDTLRVGAFGTMQMLELARGKGARFLLASSSEVYGDPKVHPQPESYWGNANPVGPRGSYDEAKRFAEALSMAYRSSHGVDTAVVRIFNTFGPRMRPHDGRAIPTFVGQALAGEPLTVSGDGRQTRSFCYVDDLVEGVIRLLRSTQAGPVNLGNPRELTVRELAELVCEVAGSASALCYVNRPQDDPMFRRPDITLANNVLGWEPCVTVEEGLRRTVAWFREHMRSTIGPESAVPIAFPASDAPRDPHATVEMRAR